MSKLHRRVDAVWREEATIRETAEINALDAEIDKLAAEHMALARRRGLLAHKIRARAMRKRNRRAAIEATEKRTSIHSL